MAGAGQFASAREVQVRVLRDDGWSDAAVDERMAFSWRRFHWSSAMIEGCRRAEIHEAWRRVHARRKVKLGSWTEWE
jgi:hypothetical protein